METPPPSLGMMDKWKRTASVGDKPSAKLSKEAEIKSQVEAVPEVAPMKPSDSVAEDAPSPIPTIITTSAIGAGGPQPIVQGIHKPTTKVQKTKEPSGIPQSALKTHNVNPQAYGPSGLPYAKKKAIPNRAIEEVVFAVKLYLMRNALPNEPFTTKTLGEKLNRSTAAMKRILLELEQDSVVELIRPGVWRYLG